MGSRRRQRATPGAVARVSFDRWFSKAVRASSQWLGKLGDLLEALNTEVLVQNLSNTGH